MISTMRRRGFTLIELLVVIAIIAVLIALPGAGREGLLLGELDGLHPPVHRAGAALQRLEHLRQQRPEQPRLSRF
jgi:prepilin-type N-terminal cleavage/methylation domain-containing protein